MTVAQELRDHEMVLRDPATTWVRQPPSRPGEACAIMRRHAKEIKVISKNACVLFPSLVEAETESSRNPHPSIWNDHEPGLTREHVIAVLEEAANLAEELGI